MVIRSSSRKAALGKFGRTCTSGTMVKPPSAKTTGWRRTCQHESDPVPAIVIDPFVGSGTSIVVANALGRQAIGMDLSADYLVNHAKRRIDRPHAPAVRAPRKDEWLPLFEREQS
jgi:hypothetical protein